MHACMHTYIRTHTYTHMHEHIYIQPCIHLCKTVNRYTYMCACIAINANIHTKNFYN